MLFIINSSINAYNIIIGETQITKVTETDKNKTFCDKYMTKNTIVEREIIYCQIKYRAHTVTPLLTIGIYLIDYIPILRDIITTIVVNSQLKLHCKLQRTLK